MADSGDVLDDSHVNKGRKSRKTTSRNVMKKTDDISEDLNFVQGMAPKKHGRKQPENRISDNSNTEDNENAEHEDLKSCDNPSLNDETEASEEVPSRSKRRRTVKTSPSDPQPGTSADFSDSASESFEDFDDSDPDNDPVWKPTTKSNKGTDADPFSVPTARRGGKQITTPRKRGPKPKKEKPQIEKPKKSPKPKVPKVTTPRPKKTYNRPNAKSTIKDIKNVQPVLQQDVQLIEPERQQEVQCVQPVLQQELQPGKTVKRNPVSSKKNGDSKGSHRGKASPPDHVRFLVAKTDLNKSSPFLWRMDRKSSMLQRFEAVESSSIRLYEKSFTFAAGNQISLSNYVTANVNNISPDSVQYLGPDIEELRILGLLPLKVSHPGGSDGMSVLESLDQLKEDFSVYLQSLLSQDLDSNFFSEILSENDEYFLIPIKNLESIAEEKKKKISMAFWDEDLEKTVKAFPFYSISDNITAVHECCVCKINIGHKLLLFTGQPYNRTTLAPKEMLLKYKTTFDVCDKCSATVVTYSRLHNFRHTFFHHCSTKASEVKLDNEEQPQEEVLKACLEDHTWVDRMFQELVKIIA